MLMMNDMPCRQDCENRTATCKFDGSCSLYDEWKANRTEKLNAFYVDKRISKTAENYSIDKTMKNFKKKAMKKK